MAAIKKVDFINEAYSMLRISGITVIPTASDYTLALTRIDSMMADLFANWGVSVGYDYDQTPNINSYTNVKISDKEMISANLAVRLAADFGKDVPQSLAMRATVSLSRAVDAAVKKASKQIQAPGIMPVGSANEWFGRHRYHVVADEPPAGASTIDITKGETLKLFEDFQAWLGTNTISSYTISGSTSLTISASANATPQITYTVTAPTSVAADGHALVKITVTDSASRTVIRFVDFNVITPQAV